MNSNIVTLIPKLLEVDRLEQYRLIAMAKILADRLANIAPKVIMTQQRGFVKGQNIVDCVCGSFEAFNMLNQN